MKTKKLSLSKLTISKLTLIESKKVHGGTYGGNGCGKTDKVGDPGCGSGDPISARNC